MPQMPAARVSDTCQHGGVIMPPGAIKTMVEMLPAARITDMHVCPMVTGVVPHVGGPVITGAFTIMIEMLPATRVMEKLVCVGPPDMIAKGASKTFYGDGGGGGGASASVSPPAAPNTPNPPMPQAPGSPGASAIGNALAAVSKCTAEGDPVDVATGRVFALFEEFATQGTPPLSFVRFYGSSSANQQGDFGYGWTHTLAQRITWDAEFIAYHDWQGRSILFLHPAEGDNAIYHLDENIRLVLTEDGFEIESPDGSRLVFQANAAAKSARLVAIVGEDEKAVSLAYTNETLARVTDSTGNRYLFESADGRHIAAIAFQAAGSAEARPIARYEYDRAGNLICASDAISATARYHYDSSHRLIQRTDKNGFTFHWEYDSKGRCQRAWGRDGMFLQTFEYSETDPMTVVRDAQGHPTTYLYNDLGMVTEVVDALGNRQKFEYQGGHLVKKTDALGRETEFTYDIYGRVIGVKQPGGAETKHEYTPDGAETITDAGGNVLTLLSYQGKMILALADAPDQPLLTTEADPENNAILLTDANGASSRLFYDAAGRMAGLEQPLGQRFQYQYDAQGNRTAISDPAGAAVRFAYDPMNRLSAIQRDGGSGFQFHYDAEGQLAYFVDGNRRATNYRRDGFERVTAVTSPLGATNRYDYDRYNRLTKISDARNAETRFEYNALGQLERILRPDGRCEYLTYDAAGQRLRFLDRGGIAADSEYDADGNRTGLRYIDGVALEFGYDAAGRIVRAANADCETTFAYDELGRLTEETLDGAAIRYEYNKTGQLAALVLPTDEAIRYGYDANGRLTRVTDMDRGQHQFTYSDAGPLLSHTFPNGLTARYELNPLGLTEKAEWFRPGSSRPVAAQSYRYDGNDSLTEIADSELGRVEFEYDPAGQITQAAHQNAGLSEFFAYDPTGNPTDLNQARNLNYDPCNQLRNGLGIRCLYDERGNVTYLEDQRGAFRFHYSGQNLMTRADLPDGSSVEYAYDPFGRRILKKWGETETRYLWAGHQLLAESVNGDREEMRWYIFLPRSFAPLAMRVDGAAYYFHCGERNAPERVSDQSGDTVWLADYAAFGEARIRTAQISHALRLPGQFYDAETGLHYNRARYYHPQWGRYLTPDPLGFRGGLNLYAYAKNNPLKYADPLGMAPDDRGTPTVSASVSRNAQQSADSAAQPPTPDASPTADAMGSNPIVLDEVVVTAKRLPPDAPAGTVYHGPSLGARVANGAVDLIPIVGDVKAIGEGLAGKNALGEELSTGERLLSVGIGIVGLATAGIAGEALRVIRGAREAATVARGVEDASKIAREAEQIGKAGKELETAGKSVEDAEKAWKEASPYGKRLISEEIGEAGMAKKADELGYESILKPEEASGRPQGFDAIYRDPKDGAIVIGEAKGGYNGKNLDGLLGEGYGHQQGTIGWAEGAAKKIVGSGSANEAERASAQQVLDALKNGDPVRVEVFHTENLGGVAGETKHYLTDSFP